MAYTKRKTPPHHSLTDGRDKGHSFVYPQLVALGVWRDTKRRGWVPEPQLHRGQGLGGLVAGRRCPWVIGPWTMGGVSEASSDNKGRTGL
jgi:hypothetical protein